MNDPKRTFEDWLDDLCVRFIINLPHEELSEAERTCFQIEEAQWFYEDFIRPLDPEVLPSLNLRHFFILISERCPILRDYPREKHLEAFEKFLQYKTRVPVRGAIMLNDTMDAVVLVKGWKKNANWSFPRGKINKEEADLDCAVREVYEETGYDLEAAGLIGSDETSKSIEVTMREQSLKMFVFRGVPMDTHFEPRTRKEISKIQWYKISELPTFKKNKQQTEGKGEDLATNANKFYMVAPFLGHLKKWIGQQRKLDKAKSTSQPALAPGHMSNAPALADSEEHQVEASIGTRGDIDKLLDQHRQKKQQTQVKTQAPSDLPEVSQVAPLQERSQMSIPPINTDMAQAIKPQDSLDLLALLKGGNTSRQEPPPQTPAAQMIEEPVMPHSPPHHHLSRMPTLPMAPTLASLQDQIQDKRPALPNKSQVRSIPPPAQPGRLVPQARHLQYNSNQPVPSTQRQTIAPYQRTGDPHFALAPSQSESQGPAIPPASNLPQPKLTQQKASLLGLFKAGNTTKLRATTSQEIAAEAATAQNVPTKPPATFTPPQVSVRSPAEKISSVAPVTGQKANLLNLFRAPSTPKTAQVQKKESSLQPPYMPVELSAMPSPAHSRGPSKTEHSERPTADKAIQKGRVIIEKRPLVPQQIPSVGATINGPLNIPQFEVVAQQNRVAKEPTENNGAKPEKKFLNPITILARPQSSHTPAATPSTFITKPPVATEANAVPLNPDSPSRKRGSAQPKQVVTPIKTAQPPAPHLEAQPASKLFHPQILRRPGHAPNDLSEPSPIHPLPSPKQSIPMNRAVPTVKPAVNDHKKSLLSLFSAPSPTISPPSATPVVGDSLAALVSPMSEIRGPELRKENTNRAAPDQVLVSGFVSSADEASKEVARLPKETPLTAKREKQMGKESNGNVPLMGNGKAPELGRRESAKQTPTELRDLLLKGLANIRV